MITMPSVPRVTSVAAVVRGPLTGVLVMLALGDPGRRLVTGVHRLVQAFTGPRVATCVVPGGVVV